MSAQTLLVSPPSESDHDGRSAATVLRQARLLIAREWAYTPGERARDAMGCWIPPGHPSAVTFDLEGAVARSSESSTARTIEGAAIALAAAATLPRPLDRFAAALVAEARPGLVLDALCRARLRRVVGDNHQRAVAVLERAERIAA